MKNRENPIDIWNSLSEFVKRSDNVSEVVVNGTTYDFKNLKSRVRFAVNHIITDSELLELTDRQKLKLIELTKFV